MIKLEKNRPSPKELFTNKENSEDIEVFTQHFDVIGLSTSPKPPSQEETNLDSVSIVEYGDSIVLSIVDGVLKEELEETRAESASLGKIGSMKEAEDFLLKQNESGMEKPFLWVKTTPDSEKGTTIIEWVAQGDLSIWANNKKKYLSSELLPIYMGLGNNNFEGGSGMLEIIAGSNLMLSTDGGVESLINPSFLENLFTKKSDIKTPHVALLTLQQKKLLTHTQFRGKSLTEQGEVERYQYFREALQTLHLGFEAFIGNKTIRKIRNRIRDNRDQLLDDSTFISIKTKPENEVSPYSKEVIALFDELMSPTSHLETTMTQKVVKEFGAEIVAQLVEEMVEKNQTGGPLFARACSLVKFDELSEKAQTYFENKDIVILPIEITVHPAFINEKDAHICNDIGHATLRNVGRRFNKSLNDLASQIDTRFFKSMDKSNEFKSGAWGHIRHTTGQHITIPGSFVTGKTGRGILVPTADTASIYLHSPTEHEKDKRKFFIMSSGIASETLLAFAAYSRYLNREENQE